MRLISKLRRPGVAVSVAVAAIAAVGAAPAAVVATSDARTRTITYRDTSTYRQAVTTAISMWNASPVNVRLVRARRGRPARIRIVTRQLATGIAGMAQLGGGPVWLTPGLDQGPPEQAGFWVATEVAAHEIGHSLSLKHLGECTLMAPVAMLTSCPAPVGRARCGPQLGDVRKLARRFGYRPGRRAGLLDAAFGTCAAPTPEPPGPSPEDEPPAPVPPANDEPAPPSMPDDATCEGHWTETEDGWTYHSECEWTDSAKRRWMSLGLRRNAAFGPLERPLFP